MKVFEFVQIRYAIIEQLEKFDNSENDNVMEAYRVMDAASDALWKLSAKIAGEQLNDMDTFYKKIEDLFIKHLTDQK